MGVDVPVGKFIELAKAENASSSPSGHQEWISP